MQLRITLFALAVAGLTTLTSAQDAVRVELDTTEGKIVLELDAKKAPLTVANFLEYAKDGHYNGTVFHRVIKGFMVQGGGMDEKLNEKPTKPPIKNESANGLQNVKYTVAMARTPQPHSATSQFFINTSSNGFLNRAQSQDGWGYAVFGKVVEGKEVVDKIEGVKTVSVPNPAMRSQLFDDVPAQPIAIKSVKVLQAQEN